MGSTTPAIMSNGYVSTSHFPIISFLSLNLNPIKSISLSNFHSHQKHHHFLSLNLKIRRKNVITASSMASTRKMEEILPPPLDSTSDPPSLFDGTTRLYVSYTCPYAQRVWITRNCKVPSLEYKNEVRGESLDLMKFIDSHFEGPSLFPSDLVKQDFAGVLFSYIDSFHKSVTSSFKEDGVNAETGAAFDYIEDALSKLNDGPFFLGQLSLVDIAYVPFFERYIPFLKDVRSYDITAARPMIAMWIQEMNKIEGYKQTQTDPKLLVESYKKRFLTKL
ncbi:glutathione S-transferase L3-like isoform X2 [Chenopodium quinoa]|uniref:glutathione S-transferase L3-like isoform X2 n=1 Tax=Chenopodium quinoa TaxID=63459 RepID=UPI000B7963E7|nr:glutathione S-transferase L3-like isoform X2 [Chenopodium quinoa]